MLAVRDFDASTRFYMDVLGLKRDFGDGTDGWSFLSRDGFKVMLGHCADASPAGDGHKIMFGEPLVVCRPGVRT